MKIGRTEKIWLASVLFFWVFYNFRASCPTAAKTACIVHGLISFVGTVLSVYIGCKLTEKEYPLIEDEEQDETAEDNTPAASETQKESDKIKDNREKTTQGLLSAKRHGSFLRHIFYF